MLFSVRTDIGRKRTFNEDQAAVFERGDGTVLAVIADGMGGHRSGDVASAMAVRLMGEQFSSLSGDSPRCEKTWTVWLDDCVRLVNRAIYEKAQSSAEHEGMGTTLEAAVFQDGRCHVVHVGDSRVYFLGSDDTIRQVTKDHSYVNALLASGEITEAEAEVHPQRNWIVRAVGSEKSITPDFYQLPFGRGDCLLLCTDGLSNKVEPETMHALIRGAGSLDDKVARLIDMANERGGEDNITAVLLTIPAAEAGAS